MPTPPTPPRPQRRDSPLPCYSPDERELWLRELRRLEARIVELERAVIDTREIPATVRDLAHELRELSHEVRDSLARDLDQERAYSKLNAQVQTLAMREGASAGMRSGLDSGSVAGAAVAKDVARETASGAGTKWAVIAMLISALTAGVIQGLAKAFEPVRPPAPIQQLPP